MAIIRTKRADNFTVINNDLINDTLLDWRELGLLIYLLSKPDGWQVNTEHLSRVRKTGAKGIYSCLKNISAAGYVTKKPKPPPAGGWDWLVFDVSQKPCNSTECLERRIPTKANAVDGECLERRIPTKANAVDGGQVNTDYLTNTDYSVNTEKAVITTPPENFENSEVKLNAIQYEVYVWASSHEYWHKATTSEEEFLRAYCSPKGGMRKQFEQRHNVKSKPNTAKGQPPTNIFAEMRKEQEQTAAIDSTATVINNDIKTLGVNHE